MDFQNQCVNYLDFIGEKGGGGENTVFDPKKAMQLFFYHLD